MVQSPAQRRASSAAHKRRQERGMKKITVWVTPEDHAAMESLRPLFGSREAVIAAAIRALVGE